MSRPVKASESQNFWRKEDPILTEDQALVMGGMWSHQRDWWNLTSFIKVIVGGYGSGKTNIGSKRAIASALTNAPAPVAVISPTYKIAKETCILTLYELLAGKQALYGANQLWWKFNKTDHEFQIRYRGRDARILIYSGDNPLSLRGPNLAAAWIDEPFMQDREVFMQMLARVRHPAAVQSEILLTGCVARDSLVLTPDGFKEIQSLDPGTKKKEYKALQMPIYGESGFHDATKFYNNGFDDTRRLVLSNGFELSCTPDHPVATLNKDLKIEYKRVGSRKGKYADLQQLSDSDYVGVACGMDVWGNNDPEGVTLNDAYGMGLYIAEGSYYKDSYRVTFCLGDKELVNHMETVGLFGELFKSPKEGSDASCIKVIRNNKRLVEKIKSCGIKLVKSPKRYLPDWVMAGGSKEMVIQFLSGMWDGDGHVCSGGQGMGYSTTSKKLARQLQVLLLDFGIVARLRKGLSKAHDRIKVDSIAYQVVVSGNNAAKLATILDLKVTRKRDQLKLYSEVRDNDCLPQVGYVLLGLWKSRKKQRWRNCGELKPYRILESIRQSGNGMVSLTYARAFCNYWRSQENSLPLELLQIENLLSCGIHWLPIKSNKVGRVRQTYDFVIPDTNTVVFNGILSKQTPESLNWGYEICDGDEKENFDIDFVTASTRANKVLLPGYVERLEEAYTEKAAQSYIDGNFVNLSEGMVFYAFDRMVHVRKLPIPEGITLGAGMDFNVNPMAMTVFWRSGNHMHFIKEYQLPNADTEFACQTLREDWGERITTIYPDATGNARKTAAPGGKTDFYYIRKAGFEIAAKATNPKRRDSYNAVNGKFKPKNGQMTLSISPECKKLKGFLLQYSYELMKKQEKMSHLLDSFRYPVSYLFPVDADVARTLRVTGT